MPEIFNDVGTINGKYQIMRRKWTCWVGCSQENPYFSEGLVNLYLAKSFFITVFTSLMLRIMIFSLDYVSRLRFASQWIQSRFFPFGICFQTFSEFFSLYFSSSYCFSSTSSFFHFLMKVHPFRFTPPNYILLSSNTLLQLNQNGLL